MSGMLDHAFESARLLRTSETDPIRVDFLPQSVLQLPGRLGLTFAPGKRHRGLKSDWCRDLDADLKRLRAVYRADVLVSLLEPRERRALEIPDMLSRCRRHGIRTRAFAIPDASVPKSTRRFVALTERLVKELREGRTVVVHCRGGNGRSGLVAACVLVRLGHEPTEALAAVRVVRPGAVETVAQEQFVLAVR